ncbi:MAG: Crp/Fnr family transcriptional regulator [Chloroflexi bacterium]|nr:Crp/Fnr family transcriptional regulator [Chloroflexota bacterium]
MAWLDSVTSMVNYRKGQLIYSPDDPKEVLFLLKKGKVQLYRLSTEGKKLVLALLDAGTFFGEMALVGQGMYGTFAEVVQDALVCAMTRHDVVQLLSTRPAVALRLLETLGQRFLETQTSLDALAFKSVKARLASLLLRLARQKGDGVIEGIGHQDLAEMAVALRETVTQVLDEFKALGLLDLGRLRIKILNYDELRKMAEE